MTKTKKRGSRWRIAALILAACAVLGAFGAAQQRSGSAREFSLADTASYSGTAYVVVNGNEPYFTEDDYTTEAFETYAPLDALGRCGTAFANLCPALMPTEERGSIGQVQPSGWHTVRYDFVDCQYLYNRCHLIGYQLAGENANEQNLITGTRYLNVEGMLPFENMVADYITETGNHVLYRVTPEFEGDNLLASGVRIEAASVEDDADGICFHVYCYNVQPGVIIDYATGGSHAEGEMAQSGPESDDAVSEDTQAQSGAAPGQESEQPAPVPPEPEQTEPAETTPEQEEPAAEEYTYVVNTNTYKFHLPGCASADDIKPENRLDYTGTREALIEQGYDPCGRCKP